MLCRARRADMSTSGATLPDEKGIKTLTQPFMHFISLRSGGATLPDEKGIKT